MTTVISTYSVALHLKREKRILREQDEMRESKWLRAVQQAVRTGESGQILVMFAMMLVLFLGMLGLAVDAGFLMAERRQVQSSADAGALSAAKAKLDYFENSQSNARQISSGQQYAARNADVAPADVTVDPNPSDLGSDYVRVSLRKEIQPFFIRALYSGEWYVDATAVAAVQPDLRPYALLALGCGPSGAPGIYINGSGYVNAHEGSIMSNCGIDRSGTSSTVLAAGSIDAYGTLNPGPLWSAGQGFNQRNQIGDPIVEAGIVAPTKSAVQSVRTVTTSAQLTGAITNLTNASATGARCPNNTTCVMQPGYYGGNLTLDVRGTLRMQPGLYYFGDNFRLEGQSNNASITGTNVMLYFGDNARFDPGNAKIELEASQTTLYAGGQDGMLIWIANCTPFLMQSNGQFLLNGVIYAPCSQVRLYGSPGSNGVQVIVGSLELSGSGNFDILFTEYVRASVPRVYLVQ